MQNLMQRTVFNQIKSKKKQGIFRAYGVIPVDIDDCDGNFYYDTQQGPKWEDVSPHASPSAVNQKTDEEWEKRFDKDRPSHVHWLIDKSGGKKLPICLGDWGNHMKIISEDLSKLFTKKGLYLNKIPDVSTLRGVFK